jgi:hypothetical protein
VTDRDGPMSRSSGRRRGVALFGTWREPAHRERKNLRRVEAWLREQPRILVDAEEILEWMIYENADSSDDAVFTTTMAFECVEVWLRDHSIDRTIDDWDAWQDAFEWGCEHAPLAMAGTG